MVRIVGAVRFINYSFMRNELGVLIGMIHYMIPYAVLPLLVSMQAFDHRVMDASRNRCSVGYGARLVRLPRSSGSASANW